MKKLLFIAGILLLASCSKDEIFLEMEEQMELIQKDTTKIDLPPTTSTTNSKTYTLYKESILNKKSGTVFMWGWSDKYYPTLIYNGNKKIHQFSNGHAYHDINGDGFQDILVGPSTVDHQQWISFFINQGDNKTYISDEKLINGSTDGLNSHKICKTDVNNDGIVDFVIFGVLEPPVTTYYSGQLTILIGNTRGTFDTKIIPNPNDYFFHNGSVGDLNGDNNVDLIGADYIWWGDGMGNFVNSQIDLSEYVNSTVTYEIIDINKDGWNDLILGSVENPENPLNSLIPGVIVLNDNGKFSKDNKVIKLEKSSFIGVASNEVVDIDGDGDLDLIQLRIQDATPHTGISKLFLYRNDGNVFTYVPNYFPESLDGNFLNGGFDKYGWQRFKFDDIDGDGIDEILPENYHDGDYNVLKKVDGSWKKITIMFGK